MLVKPTLSRTYIFAPLVNPATEEPLSEGQFTKITAARIAFTAVTAQQPAEGDWQTAIPVPHTGHTLSHDNRPWLAILQGPERGDATGSVDLAAGDWQVWAELTAMPERPVFKVDTLTLTGTAL